MNCSNILEMIFCGPNFYYVIFSGQGATNSLDREKKTAFKNGQK